MKKTCKKYVVSKVIIYSRSTFLAVVWSSVKHLICPLIIFCRKRHSKLTPVELREPGAKNWHREGLIGVIWRSERQIYEPQSRRRKKPKYNLSLLLSRCMRWRHLSTELYFKNSVLHVGSQIFTSEKFVINYEFLKLFFRFLF